jgi:hypothetical protein
MHGEGSSVGPSEARKAKYRDRAYGLLAAEDRLQVLFGGVCVDLFGHRKPTIAPSTVELRSDRRADDRCQHRGAHRRHACAAPHPPPSRRGRLAAERGRAVCHGRTVLPDGRRMSTVVVNFPCGSIRAPAA